MSDVAQHAVLVNGSREPVYVDEVTYGIVVALARMDASRCPSCMYSTPDGRGGILAVGGSVRVVDGMRFSVEYTGAS